MKTKINVTQLCLDDPERLRHWEEDRKFPLYYFENRFQWFNYPRWHYVSPFPLHVDFEVSSRCNLSCPMCFRRHFNNSQEFTDMDFQLFAKGVDECASNNLYSIRLSWRGESTSHPQLLEMIKYAKKSGIKEVSFLSNGSFLSPDFNMKLIESGLDCITISVDALRENYNKLRAPLDFDQIVKEISNLYKLKEKHGNGFPKIKVQGIYEYINNDREEYLTTFKNITDNISVNVKHDYELMNVEQEDNLFCPYLWQRITITASGLIPLCISDWDLDVPLGNLRECTIKEVWSGKQMNSYRNLHLDNKRLELKPCRKCIRTQTAIIQK